MIKKYHKDIGLPKFFIPNELMELVYTRHAERALREDRYGPLQKLSHLNMSDGQTIELEVDETGTIIKYLCRFNVEEDLDYVFALIPEGRRLRVKTIWANKKDDHHKTLDKSVYSVPQVF